MSMCMTARRPTHSKFFTKVEPTQVCHRQQSGHLEEQWLLSSPLIIPSQDKASTQAGPATARTTIARTIPTGKVSTVTVRATLFTASTTHIAPVMARMGRVPPRAACATKCTPCAPTCWCCRKPCGGERENTAALYVEQRRARCRSAPWLRRHPRTHASQPPSQLE